MQYLAINKVKYKKNLVLAPPTMQLSEAVRVMQSIKWLIVLCMKA